MKPVIDVFRLKAVVALLLLFTNVKNSSTAQSQESVETRSKVAQNQQPAFKEQTRVAEVKTKTRFSSAIITDKLTSPWGIDFLTDGRMIVSEKKGSIRIVSKDGKVSKPLKGIPPRL